MNTTTEVRTKQENPFLNLLFNIALPVFLLNYLSKKFGESGPALALLFAISLPIGYGLYDYFERKKMNYISLLGVINVAFTGGFALMKLDGSWFAIKEAFFPLLIGVFIFVSNLLGRPFLKTIFWTDAVFQLQLIQEKLSEKNAAAQMQNLFKNATHFFALSFIISAISNYVLAKKIFAPIDLTLSNVAQNDSLNQQIAQMTLQGYIVIALPMTIFMALILWYLIRNLRQITGLTLEQLLIQNQTKAQ